MRFSKRMNHICPKDTFWFRVKLNPSIRLDLPLVQQKENQFMKSFPPPCQPKDLLNLSAEKLVSDACLLREKVCFLPEKICSILLFKAICDGRVLSVVELMKYCPYEEFKIPIPDVLKKYHANVSHCAEDKLKKHYDVVVSSFSTFLNDIVRQKSCSSRLKILDLGSEPVCVGWLINRLKDFIKMHQEKSTKGSRGSNKNQNPKNIKSVKEIRRKSTRVCEKVPKTTNPSQECKKGSRGSNKNRNPKNIKSVKEIRRKSTRVCEKVPETTNPSQEYVLKCSIRVEQNHHLTEIKECFAKLKSTNLKVVFSGVFFLNVFCQQKQVQDLVENVNQDSKLLSIMFSDFNPRLPSLLNLMEKFKYLKYLHVSKMSLAQSEDLKPEFIESVSKITTLKRLVLRDIKLTGHLSLLICGSCQQESDNTISRHCCLAHSGSLKYLDISGCYLCYKDLKFLEELSNGKSLRYLDISNNRLPLHRTCQTLLLLNSSLVVLHMEHCFDDFSEYNPEVFPLSTFTQLRVLSIGGLKSTPDSLRLMYSELEKINLNILKLGPEAWVGCHLYFLDVLIKALSRH